MKTTIITMLLLAGMFASAQVSFTNTPNATILDGNPVGLIQQLTVSGVGGAISSVQVTLDITGGFNGDLYAYLVGPQGQVAILLNRVGVTGANPFGYLDSGLAITLADSGANIHGYGSGFGTNLSGQVIGTWAADGRNVDPYSAGSVFDSASTLVNLGVFNNTLANGQWTLFIADLGVGGGNANLHNVILTIMTVPEPQTWVMLIGGLALLGWVSRRRQI